MAGNIAKRRRLKDLYVVGYTVHFNDTGAGAFDADGNQVGHWRKGLTPTPQPVDGPFETTEMDERLFVQAPSPLQREMALREASVNRSKRVLAAKQNPDDDVYGLQARTFLAEMEDATLVDYVVMMGENERTKEAQREVLGRSEWKDFTTLQDMIRKWEEAGKPATDEWQPLLQRDLDFGAQVKQRQKELNEAAREAYSMQPRAELEKKALERRLDMVGNQEFMVEYEKQMLFFAVREFEDHHRLYFEDVEDMQGHDEFVQGVLVEVSGFLLQSPEEVRGLSRAAHGSESAVPPARPETSEASTPEVVSA